MVYLLVSFPVLYMHHLAGHVSLIQYYIDYHFLCQSVESVLCIFKTNINVDSFIRVDL